MENDLQAIKDYLIKTATTHDTDEIKLKAIRLLLEHHELLFQKEKINWEARSNVFRGHAAILAEAIYNGENWDKQTVAAQLHMGDKGLDYMFPGEPPEKFEEEVFLDALDKLCERAGF